MSQRWPKVIRDPVHGIIPFENNACDKLLLDLINTKEFQRLRRIKQLGTSFFVFPGADHSRFAHSIGVMHTARMFLDRISVLGVDISEEQRTAVLAAALLHDVGHGPFSHAFESITNEDHEVRTVEIIRDSSTQVNGALGDLAETIATFFTEEPDDSSAGVEIPAYLTEIVSSQLDADRFDYLLRDSYSSGTDYGQFDVKWLIQNLFLNEDRKRFYLGYKARLSAEQYVFARYHMYRVVYFHKTTRAAEVMLRLLFSRCDSLFKDTESEVARRKIVPDAPPALYSIFDGKIELSEYLALDDHSITEFVKACSRSSDSILEELGTGLLNRRLFKATDVSTAAGHKIADFAIRSREIISKTGLDPDFFFKEDAPGDTPYKPYRPELENQPTQIFIQSLNRNETELANESPTVKQLAESYLLIRYYYPESVREAVRKDAEPLLQ